MTESLVNDDYNEEFTSKNKYEEREAAEKFDWRKLRSLVHSTPKPSKTDSLMCEDDLYNILVQYQASKEEFTRFLARTTFNVCS